jgi:hypothetical protein
MFFKEDPTIPVPVIWPYPASYVCVTGDFNSFALQEMHGEDQKSAVIWAPPARIHFRFLVDGTYLHDSARPWCYMDGKPYNYLDVEPVPAALMNLKGMSLDELERLDAVLFLHQVTEELTEEVSLNASYSALSQGSHRPDGFSHRRVNAAVLIQKHIRRFLAQKQFSAAKTAALHIQRACRLFLVAELKRLRAAKTQAEEVSTLRSRVSKLESTCEHWAGEAKKWKNLAEFYKVKVEATLGRSASSLGSYKENVSMPKATYVHAGPRNLLRSLKTNPSRLSR